MFWPVCFSEYLLKAEYSRGRYTDLNGDNDRAPAAGSQNQVGKKFGSIFLCLSFFFVFATADYSKKCRHVLKNVCLNNPQLFFFIYVNTQLLCAQACDRHVALTVMAC